jgi:hypothetical protein
VIFFFKIDGWATMKIPDIDRDCWLGFFHFFQCFIKLEGEEEKVKDIIVEIIKNKTGVEPRVNVEHLHEPEFASI